MALEGFTKRVASIEAPLDVYLNMTLHGMIDRTVTVHSKDDQREGDQDVGTTGTCYHIGYVLSLQLHENQFLDHISCNDPSPGGWFIIRTRKKGKATTSTPFRGRLLTAVPRIEREVRIAQRIPSSLKTGALLLIEGNHHIDYILSDSWSFQSFEQFCMTDIRNIATRILREGLKSNDAELTPFQLEVIENICVQNKDVLYIDKTGAGKSETFFVATKLLRSLSHAGPVIVITPLIALMADQVRRAKAFGLGAFAYHSKLNALEKGNVHSQLGKNKVDLLFMTAEMLDTLSVDTNTFTKDGTPIHYTPQLLKFAPVLKRNRPDLSTLSWSYVPLLVVDEVHYIAEVGHDFRLTYAAVWAKFANHPWFIEARKLGLTATITPRVRSSLIEAMPAISHWHVVLGSIYRENISLRILPKPIDDAARVDYVYKLFCKDPTSYILVFCKEIKDVKNFSRKLIERGVAESLVAFFHSPSTVENSKDSEILINNEKAFREGSVHVLFSTCALGLGYDKSDIHHVVHLWTPNSLVQYYQEFGRAGRFRNGEQATAHLLPTNPWNPTGWVAVLSSICWFLAKENKAVQRKDIFDRGQSLRHKDSDIERAIELGVQKGMLRILEDSQCVQLLDVDETMAALDKVYAEHMKAEVDIMGFLAHNCNGEDRCLWKFLMSQFEGTHDDFDACGRCSGMKCRPGGDIASDHQAVAASFYQVIAPVSRVPIFALNKVGEELVVDEEKIKEIFASQRPSMVSEPPGKWTICPIPDSAGKSVEEAEVLATWLNGMDVNYFIGKNPREGRRVTEATSQAERQNILENKFKFDWDKMPRVGNVLLYDDSVSSGDTIDAVVMAMKDKLNGCPMEFAALTKFVYVGRKRGSPEVRRLNASVFLDVGSVEEGA